MTTITEQRYIVRLHLNQREIARWILDGRPLSIGRTPDNDIVIDNLAISRQHARIEIGEDGPTIRDNGSVNGLEVEGQPCSESAIRDGLEVKIGKHTLSFEAEAERPASVTSVDESMYEATIQATSTPRLANPARLVERVSGREDSYPIDTAVFLMGKSDVADVQLDGMFVSDYHVEIKFENARHLISHLGGRRKLTVNGKTVSECALQDGDRIEVAGRSFRFESAG